MEQRSKYQKLFQDEITVRCAFKPFTNALYLSINTLVITSKSGRNTKISLFFLTFQGYVGGGKKEIASFSNSFRQVEEIRLRECTRNFSKFSNTFERSLQLQRGSSQSQYWRKKGVYREFLKKERRAQTVMLPVAKQYQFLNC